MTTDNAENPAPKRPTASHIDARGRRIEVTRLNALDYYRFARDVGVKPSVEDMATLVAHVRRIDATHFALPTKERDVELLIQVLDFDGIEAVGMAIRKLSPTEDDVQKEVDAAKN